MNASKPLFRPLRVLVACEFSGIVRDSFTRRGHYAMSVDLLPSESSLGDHYQGDVREILDRPSVRHDWDLMIAHPPCTHLCNSGARWFKDKRNDGLTLQADALDFVRYLLSANIPRIALENPTGIISTHIRKPDQIIQPWHFGHEETKATCLWLKGLPGLYATDVRLALPDDLRVSNRVHQMSPSKDRWKGRSRTLTGIADAMAEQWGSLYWGAGHWHKAAR